MYSPDSSEKYAIQRPSGDHDGSRSIAPTVFVRLRVSPFIGRGRNYLAASLENARTAVGEIAEFEIRSANSLKPRPNARKIACYANINFLW